MRLECNVGGKEKIARIGIGAALLGTGLLAPIGKPLRIISGVVGTMGLVTGLTSYCPASKAFHRNTCDRVVGDITEEMPA